MEPAEWDEAVMHLRLSAADVQLLGRLLDVDEHLTVWHARREVLPGTLASDALDQALGLLDEMAGGEAARLAATVRSLLAMLPPSPE